MKSRDEWDKIIEDLESSGLSVLEFARERKMCRSRLYYHRKRRTQRRRELITLKAREVRAIELTPPETERGEPASQLNLERGHSVLRFPELPHPIWLATLIKELER